MKHILIQVLLLSMVLGVILWLTGCTEETTAPVESKAVSTTPASKTIDPKCTITGKILNRCTGEAIGGAVISVGFEGVQSVTSDASGSFSFTNVPASQARICSTCTVLTGTYTLTASMVSYNSRQTDPIKKYKNFYYDSVTVTFTTMGSDSTIITGLAADAMFQINPLTILSGTVVDQSLVPVSNVTVTVNDHALDAIQLSTKTDALGGFQIAGVETGTLINIHAKSADGSLEGSVIPYSIMCNTPADSSRTQVMHEQIVLGPVDDMRPYVISLTPADSADVSTSIQFVYTFSEPIQQNPYTVTTLGVGHGTIVDDISITYNGLKKTTAPIPTPTITWNAPTYTTLTITPNGLVGSSKYTLNAATAIMKLKDRVGNIMQPNPFKTIKGDNEALYFTTAGGSAIPAAPTNFTRRIIPGVFGQLDYAGGFVGLEWSTVTGARSYNLYRSVGNGPYELRHANINKLTDVDTIASLTLAGTDPLGAISVRYQLRAVNADLVEGLSASLVSPVSDAVKPTLISTTPAGTTGPGTLNYWLYTLLLSEPIVKDSAEGYYNYAFQNTDTVTFRVIKADYLGNNGATPARFRVQLYVSTNYGLPAGYSLVVNRNDIMDLAGNTIDTTINTYVASAPPAPVLSTPLNGAVGVAATPTLTWGVANGAVTYQVQVSTVPANFATTILDRSLVTTTSLGVPASAGLASGVSYLWRVRATNPAGTSVYSAVFTFTVL